ncbi:DsbA family protein [Pseudomonas sp. KNUC1026]|uniref:DsbA family protein n=1 Tax=Pseudomonas sp. KNUC1026 TaxID=2893890 RepID=UPI001F168847|nr:DsbA family protein [Pseudomonas sp. KNUC1026]UFH50737.1 DsbA family protein [Pseudomonas sp. KNUC1026]
MRRLLYVMDPMCSWCWGFAPVAQALFEQAANAGVAVQLVMGGLRAGGAGLDDTTRDYILQHWHAVQAATGQPFRFEGALAEGFVYDTEPACRAVVTVRALAEDLAWPMARRIQQAFYAEGQDVTHASVLVALAEEVGVPRIEFADAFDAQAQVDATAADVAWARDLGIAGFPTLLAQHGTPLALLTNGYQPLEALKPLLAAWLMHNA